MGWTSQLIRIFMQVRPTVLASQYLGRFHAPMSTYHYQNRNCHIDPSLARNLVICLELVFYAALFMFTLL